MSSYDAVIAHEVESPIKRQPFSPISSTESSKSNLANLMEDLNRKPNDQQLNTIQINNTQLTTPTKTIFANQEGDSTPKIMPKPVPSTVSVPMQTAVTPAPPAPIPHVSKPLQEIDKEIEYSFEERRAGFVIPKTHLKTVLQM